MQQTRHKMAASTVPVHEHLENREKRPGNEIPAAFFQNIIKSAANGKNLEIDLSIKCRGCFAQEDEMHFLFTVFDQNLTLADILMQTAAFECKEGDNLPPYLCTKCTSSLIDFFNFKIQYQKTDAYVRTLLRKAVSADLNCIELKQEIDNTSDFDAGENDNHFENDNNFEDNNVNQLFETVPDRVRLEKPEKYVPDIGQIAGVTSNCQICQAVFPNPGECETHLAKYHGINPFQKYATFRKLIFEQRKTAQIEKKKQKYLAMEQKEMEIKKAPGKYCRFCDRKFPELEFQRHWQTHKVHICELCGFKFIKSSELKIHQTCVHNDVRNFTCSFCFKTFKTKALQRRHEYTLHINPRAYCCDQCGQRFNDHATMRTHVQLRHVGSREYICPICGLDFPLKATLNKHILRHNKNRPPAHYCQVCLSGFRDKSSLRRHHLVKHTNDFVKPQCEVCSKSYCSKTKLRYHVERHHSGRPPVKRGRRRGTGGRGGTVRSLNHYDLYDSTSDDSEDEDDTTESDSDSSSDSDNVAVNNEPKVKVEY